MYIQEFFFTFLFTQHLKLFFFSFLLLFFFFCVHDNRHKSTAVDDANNEPSLTKTNVNECQWMTYTSRKSKKKTTMRLFRTESSKYDGEKSNEMSMIFFCYSKVITLLQEYWHTSRYTTDNNSCYLHNIHYWLIQIGSKIY